MQTFVMKSLREFFELLPFAEEDALDYPFSETVFVIDDIHIAYQEMQNMQDWLTENIGYPPAWCIGRLNIGDKIHTLQILFKNPEDLTAFKLRWL